MTHHHTERMDESNIVLLREDAPDLIAIVEESIPGGAVIAYAYDRDVADIIVSALNQRTNEAAPPLVAHCRSCDGTLEPLNDEGWCGSCVRLDAQVDEHGPMPGGPLVDRRLTLDSQLNLIAAMMSEDGENPEYDRACVEIACVLAGRDTDEWREQMSADLRHRQQAGS